MGSLLKSPKLQRLQVSSHCNFECGLPMEQSGLCQGESMKVKIAANVIGQRVSQAKSCFGLASRKPLESDG